MLHVQASKVLHHLVGMTVEALVLKKKKSYKFLATMAKRVVQWSKVKINSNLFAAIMENRFHKPSFYFIKIIITFKSFLCHQNIDWVVDMDIFLFWCQNWGYFHQLKLVKCDNYLLRSTIHYLHYNNWIKQLVLMFSQK